MEWGRDEIGYPKALKNIGLFDIVWEYTKKIHVNQEYSRTTSRRLSENGIALSAAFKMKFNVCLNL